MKDSDITAFSNALKRFQTLLQTEIKHIKDDDEYMMLYYSYDTLDDVINMGHKQIGRIIDMRERKAKKEKIKKFKDI